MPVPCSPLARGCTERPQGRRPDRAAGSAGIDGSETLDMTLEVVETRFTADPTSQPKGFLSDSDPPLDASDARILARKLRPKPRFTPCLELEDTEGFVFLLPFRNSGQIDMPETYRR